MKRSVLLLLCSGLYFSNGIARADWETQVENQAQASVFIVVGRVTEVTTNYHPEFRRTVARGTIQAHRHLKGLSDVRKMEVEFQFPSLLGMSPDTEDVIWFIRRKLEDGRYLVVDWKCGQDSLGLILDVLSRLDKTTRIPGMPTAVTGKGPLSVTLAADDGQGRAATAKKVPAEQLVGLLVQFENHGVMTQAVMRCLDGSEVHWRYPYYDIEIVNAEGNPVANPSLGGRCGNTNPLRAVDIVALRPGEVFRTGAPPVWSKLAPGKYRVRLVYTAKRDPSSRGLPHGPDDKETQASIKTVWEGTLVSNWVEIEVEPEANQK